MIQSKYVFRLEMKRTQWSRQRQRRTAARKFRTEKDRPSFKESYLLSGRRDAQKATESAAMCKYSHSFICTSASPASGHSVFQEIQIMADAVVGEKRKRQETAIGDIRNKMKNT